MECNKLLDGYFNFLRKDLSEIKEKDYCQLELPFPRPSGDIVLLTIRSVGNENKVITDEGFVFEFFYNYGINLWKLKADSMKEVLENVRNRYYLLEDYEPEIAIRVKSDDLFKGIFQMSNIINELISMRLLITPIIERPFEGKVESYFAENNIKFKKNQRIEVKLKQRPYQFKFEYFFEKRKTYTKIITSNSIIKNWAVNFDQIKRHGNNVQLWALYDDVDGIDKDSIQAFLPDYADRVIAWSRDREKFLSLK